MCFVSSVKLPFLSILLLSPTPSLSFTLSLALVQSTTCSLCTLTLTHAHSARRKSEGSSVFGLCCQSCQGTETYKWYSNGTICAKCYRLVTYSIHSPHPLTHTPLATCAHHRVTHNHHSHEFTDTVTHTHTSHSHLHSLHIDSPTHSHTLPHTPHTDANWGNLDVAPVYALLVTLGNYWLLQYLFVIIPTHIAPSSPILFLYLAFFISFLSFTIFLLCLFLAQRFGSLVQAFYNVPKVLPAPVQFNSQSFESSGWNWRVWRYVSHSRTLTHGTLTHLLHVDMS